MDDSRRCDAGSIGVSGAVDRANERLNEDIEGGPLKKWLAGFAGGAAAILSLVAMTTATLSAQDMGERTMSNTESQTLVEALRAEDLTVFADLLEASGLAASFSDDEPLTFFAPTNAAFADVAEDAVEGEEEARKVVSYLTAKGRIETAADAESEAVESIGALVALRGISVMSDEDGRVVVSDPDESAYVARTLTVGPHVIHVIDGVLLPAADAMH